VHTRAADKKWLETEMARIEKWLEKVEAKAGQGEEKGNDEEEEEEETEDEEEGKKGAKKGGGKGKGRKQNGGKENGGEEDEEEEVPSFCLVARANAFLRRAIREAIEEKWPGLVTETRGGQVSQSASSCETELERTRGLGPNGMEELRSNRWDDDDVAAGGDEADGRGEGRAAQGAACGEGRQAQRHRRAPTRRQGRLHSHI
jgi:hypothetical protein